MSKVQKLIRNFEQIVDAFPSKIAQIPRARMEFKPVVNKWSKKEILGHLCDSCFNNLQRIIRVQYEDKPYIIYNQNEWVKIQNYQEKEVEEIVQLWISLHKQFVQVLKNFPENHLYSIIDVGNEVTAKFIITDYLDHHYHHLKQILGTREQ